MRIDKVIRRFLPVGQGAFYCEQFYFSGSDTPVNVVYDCGSGKSPGETVRKNSPLRFLKEQIEKCFPMDGTTNAKPVIESLYISHFDNDHINGIKTLLEYCELKNIYLPVLDGNTRAMYLVNQLLKGTSRPGSFVYDFIRSPRDALQNILPHNQIKLFYVSSVYSQQLLPDIPPDQVIPSGTEIQFNPLTGANETGESESDHPITNWIFVPFNFNQPERLNEFLQKLNKAIKDKNPVGTGVDEITVKNVIDVITSVLQHKKYFLPSGYELKLRDIKDAYKSLTDGINANSMTLYSGMIPPMDLEKPSTGNSAGQAIYCPHCAGFRDAAKFFVSESTCPMTSSLIPSSECPTCHIINPLPCGCLYTGDYNAKDFYRELRNAYSNYIDSIGCVQLPHHGSKDSYNSEILQDFTNAIFVVSAGSTNQYNHPSPSVIIDLLLNGHFPFIVTEEPDSELTMIIQRNAL